MPSHPVCARLRRPPAELAILARKQRYSLTLPSFLLAWLWSSPHSVPLASPPLSDLLSLPVHSANFCACSTFFDDSVVTGYCACFHNCLIGVQHHLRSLDIQHCSAATPAPYPLLPTPEYINYSAQLMLHSPVLLAHVGSSARMDYPQLNTTSARAQTPSTASIPYPSGTRAEPPLTLNVPHGERRRRPGFLPSPQTVSQRSISLDKPLPAIPRSAPPTQTSYSRTPSSNASMSSGRDWRPSPLRVPSRPGTSAIPAHDTPPSQPVDDSRRPSQAESAKSPPHTYAGAPWADSPPRANRGRDSQGRARSQSETFEDLNELHQFAEATSGFEPFSPLRGPQHPTNSVYGEHYGPRISSQPSLPTYEQVDPPSRSQTSSQALAEALAEIEAEERLRAEQGDELPDYAQSQWEAQGKARRVAAQRAAELERQWVEARMRRPSQ
ncbi:hypothetical protein BKA80DRAFT_317308 [Phyllosticta citrichinensis]